MRFARAQRDLSLRTINSDFHDIRKSRQLFSYFCYKSLTILIFLFQYLRLENETTLTVDEVEDLINDLSGLINDEIDAELTHQSHTFVLLLRQLFIQAEHWHLRMQIDTSELQNK